MRYVFFAFLVLLFLMSCVSTGKITQSKDFSIVSSTTKIAVQSIGDPAFGASLESELLDLGFDVVPFETTYNGTSLASNSSTVTDGTKRTTNSSTSVYDVKYIPANIVLSINLKLHTFPMATYFLGGHVRVIDLTDKKLLASFEYVGSEFTLYDSNALLKKFMEDFSKRIETKKDQ